MTSITVRTIGRRSSLRHTIAWASPSLKSVSGTTVVPGGARASASFGTSVHPCSAATAAAMANGFSKLRLWAGTNLMRANSRSISRRSSIAESPLQEMNVSRTSSRMLTLVRRAKGLESANAAPSNTLMWSVSDASSGNSRVADTPMPMSASPSCSVRNCRSSVPSMTRISMFGYSPLRRVTIRATKPDASARTPAQSTQRPARPRAASRARSTATST